MLNGLQVLVTRPAAQADSLCQLIEQAGGEAIRFPALAMQPLPANTAAVRSFESIERYDWLIFVSANAVRYAQAAINDRINTIGRLRVAAIGQATAQALRQAHVATNLIPPEPYNSEALLACPEMQNIGGQRCLIVRGAGGRALLGTELQQRGAQVAYAEVYRRVRPNADTDTLIQRWQQTGVDVTTVTSAETLNNLMALLGKSGRTLLQRTPIVVISQRLAAIARNQGLQHIRVANAASDAGILQALEAFHDE